MKYIYACFLLTLCFFLPVFAHQTPYAALVIKPVADLLEFSAQSLCPYIKPQDFYSFLPLSGGYEPGPYFACPRIHQLLFNEIIQVIQEKGDEVLVRASNAYHIFKNENRLDEIPALKPDKAIFIRNTFWTLKKNIVPLSLIDSHNLTKIPPRISFDSSHIDFKNIATLIMPFTDPKTKISYSAGTRFVQITDKASDANFIGVYIFDAKNNNFKTMDVPACICSKLANSNQEKIKQFVWLIKQWANLEEGYIPYVWGGSSFVHTSNKISTEREICLNHTHTTYFSLSDFNYNPKPGFDCSGIINRAAQICGIPFYLRLSTTMAALLDELEHHEKLEEGDILWKPFHVFIVSDLHKNLIIESRGHGNGEGRVQEQPLKKIFKNILTYDDLLNAYRSNHALHRLDKDGNILYSVAEFKILKLSSIWKAQLQRYF